MTDRRKGKSKKTVSLSALLILMFSTLAIVLLGLCTFSFISIYRDSLYQTTIVNSQQSVSQVSGIVNNYANSMGTDINVMADNVGNCKSREEISELFNTVVKTRSDVVSIMVYDMDGNLLDYGANGRELKKNIDRNLSFDAEMFAKGDYVISTPHVQNIFVDYYPWVETVSKKVTLNLYGKDVYIVMDISFSAIATYLDSIGIGQRGYCFVIDSNGDIVYHPQQQLIYLGLKEEDVVRLSSAGDGAHIIGGTIYTIQTLDDGNWKVVGVSYTNELIKSEINNVIRLVAINALCGIIIVLLVIIYIYNKVSKPVKRLADAMKEFEKDAENYKYQSVRGIYEIQTLSGSFSHMVINMQELMTKVKQEEITLRKTELKALQAQINPHFLYNTLDSIQWMCEQGEMQKAVEMVSSLAKLFRISISKGKELITIEDEIQHARNYLVIQSFRYKNQFTYRFEVDAAVLSYLCNKITLQPMIENAIYHGIDIASEEGEIVIIVSSEGEDIVFTVSDNGIGMTDEMCRKIINHDTADSYGIGIKNVNDRIKIYFGEQYGLKIESELDVGTKITIRFPKITTNTYETIAESSTTAEASNQEEFEGGGN